MRASRTTNGERRREGGPQSNTGGDQHTHHNDWPTDHKHENRSIQPTTEDSPIVGLQHGGVAAEGAHGEVELEGVDGHPAHLQRLLVEPGENDVQDAVELASLPQFAQLVTRV
jgi:hypothetical protein